MGLNLSLAAEVALQRTSIQPQIIFKIEGVEEIYGSNPVLKYIRIGDDGLFIDGSWTIGGLREVGNQLTAIELSKSTNVITQQLTPDTAQGSSITSFQLSLIDFEDRISRLISPGLGVPDDILGKKCKIYLGLGDLSFPEDYSIIFRGIVENVSSGAGLVTFNIAHPDQKRRQEIFFTPSVTLETDLGGNIFNTSVDVVEVPDPLLVLNSTFVDPLNAPVIEFSTYLKMNDEYMVVLGAPVSAPGTLTCGRGSLSSVVTPHSAGDQGSFVYRIAAGSLELPLALMLSGWQGPFVEGVKIESFRYIDGDLSYSDGILFKNIDIREEYGLIEGDELTITGASESGNNLGPLSIREIILREDGDTIIRVDGATFTIETESSAVCAFRSQYDCLPDGLRMSPDEVDIEQFLALGKKIGSDLPQVFYLKEPINAREFIEKFVFRPMALYAIPRKAKSSVNFHLPPLPDSRVTILNKTNIREPSTIKIQRAITKNFYNTIIYKINKDIDGDTYHKNLIYLSEDSKNRIKVGVKALVLEAPGMRDDQFGLGFGFNNSLLAELQAQKRLDRYKFAAEYLEGVKVLYSVGYPIEVGDCLIVDFTDLKVTDINTGQRNKGRKLYEVINKSLEIKTGNVVLSLLDTGFSIDSRYGLISPSSKIKQVLSASAFLLEPSYSKKYGENEGAKWNRFERPAVKIRSENGTTRNGTAVIDSIVGNEVRLVSALGFTPQEGDIMELANYDDLNMTEELTLLYAFMRDTDFADGKKQYSQY